MSTLTLNISDMRVMPGLLEYLKKIGGVSIVKNDMYDIGDDRVLTKEEGEALVMDTLAPAIKDVLCAKSDGLKMADAHELLDILYALLSTAKSTNGSSEVYFLTMYDKNEIENVSNIFLRNLIKTIKKSHPKVRWQALVFFIQGGY